MKEFSKNVGSTRKLKFPMNESELNVNFLTFTVITQDEYVLVGTELVANKEPTEKVPEG